MSVLNADLIIERIKKSSAYLLSSTRDMYFDFSEGKDLMDNALFQLLKKELIISDRLVKLYEYLDGEVLDRYRHEAFGNHHGVTHIESVVNNCFAFMYLHEYITTLPNALSMILTAAYFHDVGRINGPKDHEKYSRELFLEDEGITRFFTDEEIERIGVIIANHRASSKNENMCKMSKLLADADHLVTFREIVFRSIYTRAVTKEDFTNKKVRNKIVKEVIEHLLDKYSSKGYASFHLPKVDKLMKRVRESVDSDRLEHNVQVLYDKWLKEIEVKDSNNKEN